MIPPPPLLMQFKVTHSSRLLLPIRRRDLHRSRRSRSRSVTASVANIAAAAAASTTVARNRSRADSKASAMIPEQQWAGNQEMLEVGSRPESIRERGDDHHALSDESEAVAGETEDEAAVERFKSDARSIRSVSSVMSTEGNKSDTTRERPSLSNRLASIGVLGRIGPLDPPTTPPDQGQTKVRFVLQIKLTLLAPLGAPAKLPTGRSSPNPQGHPQGRRGSLLSMNQSDVPSRLKAEANASPYWYCRLAWSSSQLRNRSSRL